MSNSEGSIWRKWDLHVHSPSSRLSNEYPKKSGLPDWDKFIVELEKLKDVSVIGITDYFSVNGYKKIMEYKSAGRLGNIDLILPNIEFRLEDKNKDNENINVHVIFSEKFADDTSKLDTFLGNIELINVTQDGSTLTCAQSDLDTIGFDKALVKIEKIEEALVKTFGDKNRPYLLVGVANGYGGIRPPKGKGGRRDEYAKYIDEYVDLFFGRSIDKDFFLNTNKLRYIGSKSKPVIHGSDTRSIEGVNNWIGKEVEVGTGNTKELKEITWIKADPTFNGLSKAVCEPDERFFIGKEPEKVSIIRKNKSRYIKSIDIGSSVDGANWFDDKIKINPGLVAIIGKKGSGKSALADIIAHTAGTKVRRDQFSFLSDDRFLKNKQKAGAYSSEITWEDNTKLVKKLTDSSYDGINERVKYLPQSYVEAICDPFGMTDEFQREINDVIFSYVKPEDRLETSCLEELIDVRSRVISKDIANKRTEVGSINDEIIKLENKSKPDYVDRLDKFLVQRKQELDNLEKPKNVAKPKNTLPKVQQDRASKIQESIKAIEDAVKDAEDKLDIINKKILAVSNINQEVALTKDIVEKSIMSLKEDLTAIGLKSSQVVTFKTSSRDINRIDTDLKKQKNEANTLLGRYSGKRVKEDLVEQKSVLEKELSEIFSKLDLKSKEYQQFLKKSEEYEEQRVKIEGKEDDGTINTINSIKTEIDYVHKNLQAELDKLYRKRKQVTGELYDVISSKSQFYGEIYQPVIERLDQEKKKQKEAESILTFTVGTTFDREEFTRSFLSKVHHGRQGSFQGLEKGEKLLKQLIDTADLRTKDGVIKFINEIIRYLSCDHQSMKKERPSLPIEDQLTVSKADLFDFMFGLSFIDVNYSVLFNGKDLNENEFSPGEKGALLLIFYLLVDKENVPLIIDQPEENLDNESVFHLLVPYIKSAKKHRQVIIVTHNPNLAVVCDAEQIIYTEMDKRREQIRYTSGAIEDIGINKKISDILEGTLLAFDVRNTKYFRKI